MPRQAPSVLAIDELRGAHVPGLQYLGVVVDMRDAANEAAAERFVGDLAARVRAYPVELVRGVYAGDADERDFLQKHAALYLGLDDLRTIRARIEARRDADVARETGADLDDTPPPPLDFADVHARYEGKLPKGAAREKGTAT